MPSERALIRRLRSLSYGGQLGCAAPPAYDPQQEVDRRRFQLAEELLKIRAEAGSYELIDEAPKCLAAAEIIYPEIPDGSDTANGLSAGGTAPTTQALKGGGIPIVPAGAEVPNG